MKRVILFGAPGAGKGTQAEILRSQYGFVKISTGELIRAEVKSESQVGLEVKSIIERGELVSDGIIIDMVKKRLSQGDVKVGYILDGFPRTIPQASALDLLPVDQEYIFYLKVGDPSKIMGRVVTRLTCSKCAATFSSLTRLPKVDGVCDLCQSPLEKRSDDMESTIRQRIQIYRQETKPVIAFFRKKGTLIEIDASADIEQVTKMIGGYLK